MMCLLCLQIGRLCYDLRDMHLHDRVDVVITNVYDCLVSVARRQWKPIPKNKVPASKTDNACVIYDSSLRVHLDDIFHSIVSCLYIFKKSLNKGQKELLSQLKKKHERE